MLRVRQVLELALDHLERGRTDLSGPVQEAPRGPLAVLPMGTGHVLGEGGEQLGVAARMGGDALPFVEDLHDAGTGTHIQDMADPAVRNAVVALVELDVVIDTGFGLLPLGVFVGVAGKGFRAGLSSASKALWRLPGSFWKGRVLSSVSRSRMAALSSESETKARSRSRASTLCLDPPTPTRLWICPWACTGGPAGWRSRNGVPAPDRWRWARGHSGRPW